jgi:murein DD-endopeptidase MepM/ murein hydrolase activator NlpD
MKFLFLIAFLTVSIPSFAQSERASDKVLIDTLQTLYNQNSYESIFNLFTKDMKKALPLKETKEYFGGLKNQAGKMKNHEFQKYDEGYAVYKSRFDGGIFIIRIASADSKIAGLFIQLDNIPAEPDSIPVLERNVTALSLPFREEWTIFWGGDTKELNQHVGERPQKNAFDIGITDSEGKSYKTNGKKNEDYYAFGKEIIAPCDGEVVEVVDGVRDNVPGKFNKVDVAGNYVLLKAAEGEYLFFAHFKNGSVRVKKGDKVKKGQMLGQCGNSGNSSEPHLHFHIQTIDKNGPIGVKCYFEKIMVNGVMKEDYSPIKGDKVRNL